MHTEESQRIWDESQERQAYPGFGGTAAEPAPKRGTNKIPKKKKRKKK